MRQTVGIHAAEHSCVAGHDKIVLRDIVFDESRAIEHGKAIAQIAQGVVHAGQSVGGVRVKGLISTGGLVVDLHIADTRGGGAAGPDILVVGLNGVGGPSVDRVPGTCHLQEATVLLALSTGKAGTKLQSVLDLLAGHGHQAGHVAKGADGLAGLEAPGASLHIGADAAAVHNGDITVELLDLVEVGVDAVGHEVAEVGLAGADAALAGGGIVDVEFGIAHCDLLAQHIVHCADQWAEAKDGVIPAPYALEEGEQIIDQYLEPVIFHNVNGPDIGVTTCGVIVKDGLYFKDLDNSGELAPYKDWRLSPEQLAEDMVKHLRLDQQAGLVLNTLFNSPVVPTRAEATNAEGKLELGKIYKHHNPGEKPMPGPLPGMTVSIDDSHVLEKHIAAGVYRGDMRCEAGMVALYHNAGTQMLEYEACKGGVAIPYSLHTNPINIGYPDSLGIGAAVIGDGNTDMVYEMAQTDRKMMKAEGLNIMYGPQVDVTSDPRWPRTSGTYGERPDVTSDIAEALVKGYQDGDNGLNEGSVVLTIKHFPGDAPSENGFEPHVPIGQWRIYRTPGSMEKYHLPPFQRAFDHKVSSIMPDYSRIATDGRAVPQTYRGEVTSTEEVPSAYSKELITDLARNKMGFDGYVNSDSGITTVQIYGVENLTEPERYAKAISAGTDVIGGNTDPENIVKAVEDGLLPKADLDRASYNRLLSLFRTKRVDNPYLDPDKADQARVDNFDGAKKKAYEANQKAVVLVKNHEKLLPLAKSQKVCIVTFKGVDSGFAQMAQAMGAGLGNTDEDAALRKTLTEAFEKKGYTVVATPEEADVLYLHVWPISNGLVFNQYAMPVIEMGEIVTDERERNKSQKKTGNKVTVVTLKDVEKIKELADAIHARGGKVVGTCVVCNPWLLDKLEPYCDALTIQYTVSAVALNNALNAQVDVISGDFAPTGKLSLTMVSDPAVIAITEQEIDGVVREICASPNDVPGYDKDQYIDPAILANVKGGSYAYCDADGNYYRSGFGLNY